MTFVAVAKFAINTLAQQSVARGLLPFQLLHLLNVALTEDPLLWLELEPTFYYDPKRTPLAISGREEILMWPEIRVYILLISFYSLFVQINNNKNPYSIRSWQAVQYAKH